MSNKIKVNLWAADGKDTPLGPFLATNVPSLGAGEIASFHLHESNGPISSSSTVDRSTKRRRVVVAGETKLLDCVGTEEDTNCRYVVGIYDTSKMSLSLAEAPVLNMVSIPKSLRSVESKIVGVKNSSSWTEMGQTFGTKKRKQLIKSQEKNQVDVSALKDVVDTLKDTIDERATHMPSKEAVAVESMDGRPIPKYNSDATDPSSVYHIDDIIPPIEFRSIPIKPFLKVKNKDELRSEFSKIKASEYVIHLMFRAIQEHKGADEMRKVLYLSYMMRLFAMRKGTKPIGTDSVRKVLFLSEDSTISQGLADRFLVYHEESERYKFTKLSESKLLAHIGALALHLENFSVDVDTIANDMKLPVKTLSDIFRELGCRVEQNKKTEDSGTHKVASLVIPLEFPKPNKPKRK